MWLQRLQAQGLRCFEQCELNFSRDINVIYGNNGAGKTSILEGISVLSCGKSFRTNKLSHVIHQHLDELILFGEVNSATDSTIKLGIHHKSGLTELRINQEKAQKWSEIAKNLPVLDIHPESYLLVTGGPVERRKFLNWGMFHVEPGFGKIWAEYSRAIKQRNSCLRHRQLEQASFWHQSIAELGEKIALDLQHYVDLIIPYVSQICSQFGLSDELTISYYRGWNQEHSLLNHLQEELQAEEIGFSTSHGPHRGDIKISWKNQPFSKTSSRGQQKVLTIAMKIAQAQYLKEHSSKSSIYLIDELPAELDKQRREIAFDLFAQLDSQIIISAVSKASVDYITRDIKWFHVEQSCVSAVV